MCFGLLGFLKYRKKYYNLVEAINNIIQDYEDSDNTELKELMEELTDIIITNDLSVSIFK